MMARLVAIVLGFGMILVGIAGFFAPAPAEVRLSMPHNWLHLGLGALALSFGIIASRRFVRGFDLAFGSVHFLLGFLGLVLGRPASAAVAADPKVLTVIPEHLELGSVDHFFHLVLAVLFVGGALLDRRVRISDGKPGTGAMRR